VHITHITCDLHSTKNWRLILHHQMSGYYILCNFNNTVFMNDTNMYKHFTIRNWQPAWHASSTFVAPWRWLWFSAETCRSNKKSIVQLIGEKHIYIRQLRRKCTISNLHKHFIQSCTVRGKSLPVGQLSWCDNKPNNHTRMHSHSKHCGHTLCVGSCKAYRTPFSNAECRSYSKVH
jgi:hypothetical protein